MRAAEAAHPDRRIALFWFRDGGTRQASDRVGREGRPRHRRWRRRRRPPGRGEHRFASADLFAAVAPATGAEGALVLAEVTTAAIDLFPAAFRRRLAVADGVHAAPVPDGAGGRGAEALDVPANVIPVPLPPSSPRLDPARSGGSGWTCASAFRRRGCSRSRATAQRALVDACCRAWDRLAAEPGRLRSRRDQPWIQKVAS